MKLVAASPSLSSFVPSSCFTPGSHQLPGCQWRQLLVKDRPRGGVLSSVSPGVSIKDGAHYASSFVVSAFFGGSKTPPVKSAGKGCFNCLGKGAVDCAGCKRAEQALKSRVQKLTHLMPNIFFSLQSAFHEADISMPPYNLGTGKNKKNGNMFERWKDEYEGNGRCEHEGNTGIAWCYDCQGFGMIACPKCGTGGLTPEQRGER